MDKGLKGGSPVRFRIVSTILGANGSSLGGIFFFSKGGKTFAVLFILGLQKNF